MCLQSNGNQEPNYRARDRPEGEQLLRDERIVQILRAFAKLFSVHSLGTRQYLIGHADPPRSVVRRRNPAS
jgi:hypothetical protein